MQSELSTPSASGLLSRSWLKLLGDQRRPQRSALQPVAEALGEYRTASPPLCDYGHSLLSSRSSGTLASPGPQAGKP